MLTRIRQVLTPAELKEAQALLGPQAPWRDGRGSAGGQAVQHKNNEQLAQDSPESMRLQALVLQALRRDAHFFSAVLPRRILPPLFNRYGGTSNFYGRHVDSAVMYARSGERVRSDVSCTLFLADPADYDGGELVIDDTYGEQRVKLAAGDMVVYPGTSVHRVEPVTRGHRVASFFWVESMVRSDEQRRLLHDMDRHLMHLRGTVGETDAGVVGLTGTYHNLLRLWADT
jgi:PKHD-type hydroxylase